MVTVDPDLISMAIAALDLEEVGEIGATGGQKAVRHVRRAGEDLVLKVISVGSSAPDALRRAEREVDLLGSLDSRHVVRVESQLVDLDDPPRGAAWLEEFLDGDDLALLLQAGTWTWADTATMGFEVASGLAVAHDAGVVHRDLSASNIRRLANGSYKVMDFGFARHTLLSGLTVAGQPGTAGYLSPEHLNSYSGGPMPASDVFGVGILMYAALTGDLPIPYGGDDADYVRRLSNVSIADIGARRPDLAADQVAIVRRCLHPQPARRYINGNRLAEALEKCK